MNIIMIFADQMQKYALGYKREFIKTPNLDQLAKRGVSFDRAYANSPVCGPYRGNLFTGLYTKDNEVIDNGSPLPDGVDTLADCLKEAGYQTSFVGKWHLGGGGNEPIEEEKRGGFEHFIGYQCYNGFKDNICFYDEDNNEIEFNGHRTDVTTDLAIERLDMLSKKGNPFCHVVFYQAPHYPEQPSEIYEEMYDENTIPFLPNYQETEPFTPTFSPYSPRPVENDPDYQRYGQDMKMYQKLYYAMVTQIDAGVGRILKKVKELGLEDETMIVFSADHGDMQGSHGLLNKCLPYEESCGIPMILKVPEGKENVICNMPVSSIDLLPTCLDAAKIEKREDKPGMSLLPYMYNMQEEQDRYVYSEIRMKKFKNKWQMVCNKKYKLAVNIDTKQPYLLFDLENDIYEMNNLIDNKDYEKVLKDMLDVWREWTDVNY